MISLSPERRTNTFRVAIKIADFDKSMDQNVWPYRVGVRRFRPHRPKQGTWASQSAQSGANVQAGAHAKYGGPGGHHGCPIIPCVISMHPMLQVPQNFKYMQNRFNGLGEENN